MHPDEQAIARLTAEVARLAHVAPQRVRDDSHLVRDLGLDSLELLCLHAWAEEEFSARFADERLGELTSIGAIARALDEDAGALPGRTS